MGINTVEREGISFTHPARFILVGTMNPEEGEFRPQLLDRFGLCVQVNSLRDKSLRMEILKRKAEFDDDPEGFLRKWEPEQKKLLEKILKAKENLKKVEIDDEALSLVVEITSELNLDGHRADIVMLKSARAYTAFNGREKITSEEIKKVAPLAFKT
jgi:magnesium chelatase subunit I